MVIHEKEVQLCTERNDTFLLFRNEKQESDTFRFVKTVIQQMVWMTDIRN